MAAPDKQSVMVVVAAALSVALVISLLLALGSNLPSPTKQASLTPFGHATATAGPYRIAIVIPYVAAGSGLLPPYFSAFCAAASGSAALVDFLVFHDGIPESSLPRTTPSNVKLISLGSTAQMAHLFAARITGHRTDPKLSPEALTRTLANYLAAYPYLLVEFKAAMGHVFRDHLLRYSHWGYADLDIAFGDLHRWITRQELQDFDIVTFGYGDQNRVYARGQFTFHKNTEKVSQLWRGCKFLSEMDNRFYKITSGKEKLRFESAEGCYSHVILQQKDLRVKYAVKAFNDIDAKDTASTHGLYIATSKHNRKTVVYKASPKDRQKILSVSPHWFEDPQYSYSDESKPLQWEVGPRTKIQSHRDVHGDDKEANCMYWAPKKYQPDICVIDVHSTDTVFLIDGVLFKQRYEMALMPDGIVTAPFFHFQEWKRTFRESQLTSFRHDNGLGWILGRDGAIPLSLPPLPEAERQIQNWVDSTRVERDMLLPGTMHCLISTQKKNPATPISPECDWTVSWQNTDVVQVIHSGAMWSNVESDNVKTEDVTLALTLQISAEQVKDAGVMHELLVLATSNLAIWGNQPCVLLIHVAGATNAAVKAVETQCQSDSKNQLQYCLIGAIFSKESNAVSRKALMNMAMETSRTRWVVSGLMIERGLILSQESSFFAVRAAAVYGRMPGNVFVIPQMAALNDLDKGGTIVEEGGLYTPVSIVTLLEAEKGDLTSNLQSLDCVNCDEGIEIKDESDIENQMDRVWWELTETEISRTRGDISLMSEHSIHVLALEMDDIQTKLMELLRPANRRKLQEFDNSPILMVDMLGPRNGLRTDSLVPEIDEFGGFQCMNVLRLAQLATLAYKIRPLSGAFAISVPISRDAVCRMRQDETKDATIPGTGSTRCDGCFMFRQDVLNVLVKDESTRAAKAAILWYEMDSASSVTNTILD